MEPSYCADAVPGEGVDTVAEGVVRFHVSLAENRTGSTHVNLVIKKCRWAKPPKGCTPSKN